MDSWNFHLILENFNESVATEAFSHLLTVLFFQSNEPYWNHEQKITNNNNKYHKRKYPIQYLFITNTIRI